MKIRIILILLLMSSIIIYAQKPKKIKELKIKSITEMVYDNEKEQNGRKDAVIKYDGNGNETEIIEYDKLNKITKHEQYFYNSEGKKIKEIHYLPNGKIEKSILTEFNSDNDKSKESEFDAKGKLVKTEIYKYKDELRIEKKTMDYSGKFKSLRKYIYEYAK